MQDKFRAIIAGGGTGGHLYPAIALANEIQKRFPESEILFFGTSRGLEVKVLPQMGFHVKLIWLKGFQRKIDIGTLIFPMQVIVSLVQSAVTIIKYKPDVVVGTGGYVSWPAVFTATLLGFPTIIQEQNSYPGVSTRILSHFVDQVHLSFEDSSKFFKNKEKLFISGNPIRSRLSLIKREAAISNLGIDGTKKTLLIFGGSQGAHSINHAVLKILDPLMKEIDWQIIWGTGEKDFIEIYKACQKFSPRILVKPFISDMASVYAVTDLVVSRAGATTLSELQVCGLPVILVPYPFAAAGHQEANARSLVRRHAAEMVLNNELESEKFLNTIMMLIKDETKRKMMGANLKKLAKPDAAKTIVDEMMKLLMEQC